MDNIITFVVGIAGFILSMFVAGVIGQTLIWWRGKFRTQLFMIVVGVILFGLGFLATAIRQYELPADLSTFFFLMGIAMLSWGATQIFTYTYYAPAGDTGSSESMN